MRLFSNFGSEFPLVQIVRPLPDGFRIGRPLVGFGGDGHVGDQSLAVEPAEEGGQIIVVVGSHDGPPPTRLTGLPFFAAFDLAYLTLARANTDGFNASGISL